MRLYWNCHIILYREARFILWAFKTMHYDTVHLIEYPRSHESTGKQHIGGIYRGKEVIEVSTLIYGISVWISSLKSQEWDHHGYILLLVTCGNIGWSYQGLVSQMDEKARKKRQGCASPVLHLMPNKVLEDGIILWKYPWPKYLRNPSTQYGVPA